MEQPATPAKPAKKKKKGSRFGKAVLILLILLLLGAGGFLLFGDFSTDSASAGVTRARTVAVTEGEIRTTLSGSGTLAATEALTATAPADCTVEKIYFAPGESVPANTVVMTLKSDAVDAELATLYTELQSAQNKLTGTTRTRTNRNITAPRKGIVKDIRVTPGSACEDTGYLCVISTDGMMRVVLDRKDGIRLYESVSVSVGGTAVEGTVSRTTEDKVFITIPDDGYAIGTPVTVSSFAGKVYGTGTLDTNESVLVLQKYGQIDEVRVAENQLVNKGAVLFTLTADTPNDTYHTRLESVREIEDDIAALEEMLVVRWDKDAVLTTLSVAEGASAVQGDTLCYLTKADGYTLSVAIDESDIGSVKIGQSADITMDALEGSFEGTVSNLSYAGSGNYVTSFTATVTTAAIENAYPGMSATASIVTSTSGKTLVVPVAAVQYEAGKAYLLLNNGSSAASGERPSGSGRPLGNTTASDGTANAMPELSEGFPTPGEMPEGAPSFGEMPQGMPSFGEAPQALPTAGTADATSGKNDSNASDTGKSASKDATASADASSEGTGTRRNRTSTASTSAAGAEETGILATLKQLWNTVVAKVTGKSTDTANVSTFNAADYERIYVTTGMSDGSYISVSGEGLSAGTRIIYPVLETTQRYTQKQSASTTANGFGNFSGMPGMSGMPGGNFG
ncbi:MAG: hypothetical protein Q4C53_02025, partial [Clostridia bacterium]|nr:hypothetical protein [Clostridia bacterium]